MGQHSQRPWYAAPTPPPQVELNSPEPWSTLSLGFKFFSCKTEIIVIATLWNYDCWGLNDLIHVKALTPITSLFSLPLSSQPIQPTSALLSTRRTPCTHQCWAETALVLLFLCGVLGNTSMSFISSARNSLHCCVNGTQHYCWFISPLLETMHLFLVTSSDLRGCHPICTVLVS